jgi:L-threonylcarbamoyladenylate synthase
VLTAVLSVDPQHPDPAVIAEAAALLREGELVAFPTETVYGLGGNALDAEAVAAIFAAKERDASDPLIVHIAEFDQLDDVAREVSATARDLAERLWPGPLTLVLPRAEGIAPAVTAGGDTVAVRMPAHPVALSLIRAAGVPVAAPSANRFMRTSATTAAHVLEDLGGRIPLILDGGPADAGIESTVVRVDDGNVTVLRPGAVTVEALEQHLGRPVEVVARAAGAGAMASPGMLERHYAPRARLFYDETASPGRVIEQATQAADPGTTVGLLLADEDVFAEIPPNVEVRRLGPEAHPEQVARALFATLRELDSLGVDEIYVRPFPRYGAGLAVHDRLRRASAGE